MQISNLPDSIPERLLWKENNCFKYLNFYKVSLFQKISLPYGCTSECFSCFIFILQFLMTSSLTLHKSFLCWPVTPCLLKHAYLTRQKKAAFRLHLKPKHHVSLEEVHVEYEMNRKDSVSRCKSPGFYKRKRLEMVADDNGIALWSRKGQELLEVSGGQRHENSWLSFLTTFLNS